MKVIVATSVWSLALRRSAGQTSGLVDELRSLIHDQRVQMLGPIRQEILSGIRDQSQFVKLEKHLESFPDFPVLSADYVSAARFFNTCRSKGVQGSNTDFLISAIAVRSGFSIFTTDVDFVRFALHLPIILHRAESREL